MKTANPAARAEALRRRAAALLEDTGWPRPGRALADQMRFKTLTWVTVPLAEGGDGARAARARRALTLADHALALEPADGEAALLQGAAHLWSGSYKDCAASVQRALSLSPAEPNAHLWDAFLRLVQNAPEEGRAAAERALGLRPSAWAHAVRGECLLAGGKPQAALEALLESRRLEPKQPWTYVLLSEAYRGLFRFDEAIDSLSRLIRLTRDPWAYVLRARTLFNFRNQTKGLADLERALAIAPRFAEARAFRAEAYRRSGRFKASLRDFDRVLGSRPPSGMSRIQSWRGAVLQSLGRHREAIVDFTANIDAEIEANISWALCQRAHSRLALGEYDMAVADMNRAVRINPKNGWIFGSADGAGGTLDRHADVVARFTKALRDRPDWAWGYAWRGETHVRAGRFAEGLSDLERAIALDAAQSWFWAWRGLAKEGLSDATGADADFERAVALDGRYPAVYGWRARLAMRSGRHAQAVAFLDSLIALDRLSAWAYGWRGEAHARLGDLASARIDLEKAVNLHPAYADAWAWLAEVKRGQGRLDEALRDADHALGLNGDKALGHLIRGMIHGSRGRWQEQLQDFGKSASYRPELLGAEARRLGLEDTLRQAGILPGRQGAEHDDGLEKALRAALEARDWRRADHALTRLQARSAGGTPAGAKPDDGFRTLVMLEMHYMEKLKCSAIDCLRRGEQRRASGLFERILDRKRFPERPEAAVEELESVRQAWRYTALINLRRFRQAFSEADRFGASGHVSATLAVVLRMPWEVWKADFSSEKSALQRLQGDRLCRPWCLYNLAFLTGKIGGLRSIPPEFIRRHPWILSGMALQFHNAGEFGLAAKDYARAIAHAPADWRLLCRQAENELLRGRGVSVLALLGRAIALAPQNEKGQALAWRGEIEMWLGLYPEALRDLDEACALDVLWAHGWRGGVKVKLGRFDEAITDLTVALKKYPSDLESRVWLAEAHREAGRAARALEVLKGADQFWANVNRAAAYADLGDEPRMREAFLRLGSQFMRYGAERCGGTIRSMRSLEPRRIKELLVDALAQAKGCRRPERALLALWMPLRRAK